MSNEPLSVPLVFCVRSALLVAAASRQEVHKVIPAEVPACGEAGVSCAGRSSRPRSILKPQPVPLVFCARSALAPAAAGHREVLPLLVLVAHVAHPTVTLHHSEEAFLLAC
ncbi:hypothetical protein B484DRAFT_442871 [Ochromonadaceae sp. CCMP2298]|nr:hypothetical protein B484DRAFT_442871 [Ochromonadaceae sp. CCMP2298]